MEIPGEQIGERFLKEKSVELRGLIVGLDHNFSVWVIVIILIEVQLRQGGLLARQNNEGHSDKKGCPYPQGFNKLHVLRSGPAVNPKLNVICLWQWKRAKEELY